MKATAQGDFIPCPTGWQRLLIVGVEDKGNVKGAFGVKHKCVIVMESERLMPDGKPFRMDMWCNVAMTINQKTGEPSKLRKFIGDVRGRPIKNDEIPEDGYDLDRIIGHTFYGNVIHNAQNYAELSACGPLPPGQQKLQPSGHYNPNTSNSQADQIEKGYSQPPVQTQLPTQQTQRLENHTPKPSADDDLPF